MTPMVPMQIGWRQFSRVTLEPVFSFADNVTLFLRYADHGLFGYARLFP